MLITRIQINNYTHDPKPGPPQPKEAHQTLDQQQQNHHPKLPGLWGGGIIVVPNLRFALDSFVVKNSDFIWDFWKLPFPSHLGKCIIKIGEKSTCTKIHEIGKIKVIFGLEMTPV